jgi:hypothetical protein
MGLRMEGSLAFVVLTMGSPFALCHERISKWLKFAQLSNNFLSQSTRLDLAVSIRLRWLARVRRRACWSRSADTKAVLLCWKVRAFSALVIDESTFG